jgi:EAL domain-containing protein (putative c-di-GMP-specific phosphodiesterase class I)/GGDEF domain-containing protein
VRQYRLPAVRGDREGHPSRDLARAWTRAFDHVAEPELRLRAALSLARTLAGAERAIAFDEQHVLAAFPGDRDGAVTRRLFERARRVLADELVTPELYVARIAADRPERVAIRWRGPRGEGIEIARAIVAICGCVLERRPEDRAPANLPNGGATLQRLEQLVHDARRMRRSFAVVYLDVEPPEALTATEAGRDAVARRLRREVRANDHLGHLGGDAYLALVALDAGESQAYPAAQRLLRSAAAVSADATASVGVAICPEDGTQPEDLVEKAGAAAMAAASVGGVRPYWFRQSTGRELSRRATIGARLRDGDPSALLEVRYQPIFDAETGVPYALSAAAVWREPDAAYPVPPLAYLAGDPDRAAAAALERWTIATAAAAHRTWCAAGLDLPVHLALTIATDPVIEAVASGFSSDAMRSVLAELVIEPGASSAELDSCARRLHALGARIGVAAWRTSAAPFDGSSGLLDFVTVSGAHGVGTLAELALAGVVAPVVVATGVDDPEQARWLSRHGATALRGEGLAAPMPLDVLVRWASERGGTIPR